MLKHLKEHIGYVLKFWNFFFLEAKQVSFFDSRAC